MMRKLLGTMTFAFLALTNYAQEKQHNISGKIIDAQTNEPVAQATIKCNTIVVAANEKGVFSFGKSFVNAKYNLVVTSVGYTSIQQAIIVKDKNVDVEIKLQKCETHLQDLEVSSIKANDNAPFAKTNLNKKEIAALNIGQDIPFLLNQTPSVVINSDAGNGVGYTGIRIRGTDATRINVTLNGIPYNDAESQGSYFVNLPDMSSSLNAIQVQRGVGTSSNGTGAFGATINLSTNEYNEKAYAELNNSFGSFNTWKHTVKAGTGLMNNHFTVDARLSQVKSDGYIDRASSNLQSAALSAAYYNKTASLRFNFFSGKEKTYQAWNGIDAATLATNPTYNSSGTDKSGTPYDNETDNYTQKHYQLFYNQEINSSLSFNVAAFYTKGLGYYENYNKNQAYADYGLIGSLDTANLIKQQWLDNDFYGQIFSVQYKKNKNLLTVGGSWTDYIGGHYGQVIWAAAGGFEPNQKYYDVNAKKFERSFYAKMQHSISNTLSVFADAQYRFVEHDMPGFKANPTLLVNRKFNFINPKLGFTYNKKGWQTYISYAMANKEPNRDDFESGLTNQPKEEKLHDFELGVETKKKDYSFAATAYYMLYKDQLVLTGKINDVGAFTRTNVANSYRAGVELQGSYLFAKWLNITTNITFSKNKIKEFSEFAVDYDNGGQVEIKHNNTDITLSPNVISSNQVNFIINKNIGISLVGKYVGKQYLDNTENEGRALNSYYTQDIKASIKIPNKLFKETVLMASLNNVFNKRYQPNGYTFSYVYAGSFTTENYYFPMAGTNFMLSLNVKL
jgi:iron complex outermembrane receptor protein